MKRLADLFFNKREKGDYTVSSYENMREEDQEMVEDLMRDFRVMTQINNSCKDVKKMSRGDEDVEVANFIVNLGATSIEAKIKIVITLLKASDESELKVTLYSLVTGPTTMK